MSVLAGAAGLFCLVAVSLHVIVAGIVAWRSRRPSRKRTPRHLPSVTIIRPLAWVLRDMLLPLLWMQAWAGRSFTLRRNDMQAVRTA